MRQDIVEVFLFGLLVAYSLADENITEKGEDTCFCQTLALSIGYAVSDDIKVVSLLFQLVKKLSCTGFQITAPGEIGKIFLVDSEAIIICSKTDFFKEEAESDLL